MFADCELVSVTPRCAAPPVCASTTRTVQVIRRMEVERPGPKDVHLTDIPAMSLVSFPRSECCACEGGAVALGKRRQILQTSTGGECPACATCACAQAAECVHDGGRMASWASAGAIRCGLFCRPR